MNKLVVTIEVAENKEMALEKAKDTFSKLDLGEYIFFTEGKVKDWGFLGEGIFKVLVGDKTKLKKDEFRLPVQFTNKTVDSYSLLQTLFTWSMQEKHQHLLRVIHNTAHQDMDQLIDDEPDESGVQQHLRESFKLLGGDPSGYHVFSGGEIVYSKRELLDLIKVKKGLSVFLIPVSIK